MLIFCFFKQKTAYEMRIGDWSSDVCSSDLKAFESFVQNIPFYGFAAMCLDHPTVQAMIPRVSDRRIVTYGFSPQADVRGVDVEVTAAGSRFTAVIADRKSTRLNSSH